MGGAGADSFDAGAGVRVSGIVAACAVPLVAPMAGIVCVAYETRIKRLLAKGNPRTDIARRLSEVRVAEIAIAVGPNTYHIDATTNLRLVLHRTRHDRWLDQSPGQQDRLRALLTRQGYDLVESRPWNSLLSLSEGRLSLGDHVIVEGFVQAQIHPLGTCAGYRQAPVRNYLVGTSFHPLTIRAAEEAADTAAGDEVTFLRRVYLRRVSPRALS